MTIENDVETTQSNNCVCCGECCSNKCQCSGQTESCCKDEKCICVVVNSCAC